MKISDKLKKALRTYNIDQLYMIFIESGEEIGFVDFKKIMEKKRKIYSSLSKKEFKVLFQSFDSDKNQKIDISEFLKNMNDLLRL